jgi:hypothetical protein
MFASRISSISIKGDRIGTWEVPSSAREDDELAMLLPAQRNDPRTRAR